jgi:hypothetical protein
MQGCTGSKNRKKVALFPYDFSLDGGAIGSITKKGGPIPKGAIIKDGVLIVKTPCEGTATTATLGITALSALDILGETAMSDLTPANVLVETKPLGTAGTSIRVTSAITSIDFVIATSPLTAGKVTAAIEYLVTDPVI